MGRAVSVFLLATVVLALQACVSYETSCGTGQFTYEPYPARLPAGAVNPPIYNTPTDADCVSPGSSIEIVNLDVAYPNMATIQRLELAIFHTRYDPNAIGAAGPSNPGVWRVLEDPDYIEVADFDLADGTVNATIPFGITGQPPTAASIRMTYADNAGRVRVVDIEADRRDDLFDHGLYFVPFYRVYLARSRVDIGWNAFDNTIVGETIPAFGANFPRGWEEHCRLRDINISDSGFPGEIELVQPFAQVRRPSQGYRVRMPASRTGSFFITHQIVCPADLWPSGQTLFTDWGLLGNYVPNIGSTGLERGMPAITSVNSP